MFGRVAEDLQQPDDVVEWGSEGRLVSLSACHAGGLMSSNTLDYNVGVSWLDLDAAPLARLVTALQALATALSRPFL